MRQQEVDFIKGMAIMAVVLLHVSIGSNIAEGVSRPSDVDFAHYLDVA